MAASNAPGAFRLQSEGIPRVRGRHYPLLRRGSATRYVRDLRHHPLRLRCAPPSSTPALPLHPRARSEAKREQVGDDFANRVVWHHLWWWRHRTRRVRLACSLKALRAFAAATTPCCAGGSATRHVRDLQHRPLRLRCAPPSSTPAPPLRPRARSEAKREQVGDDFDNRVVWHHLWWWRPRTRRVRSDCSLKAHAAFAAATTPCCAGG